jgi:hypothetical protein
VILKIDEIEIMSPFENKPLVSAAELEALIQGMGNSIRKESDNFFPLRMFILSLVAGSYAFAMLFFSSDLAKNLSIHQLEIERITKYIYFRGWFLVFAISFGLYSYHKNRYFGIVLCGLLLTGCVNLLSDFFNIYAEILSTPTPIFTLILTLRLACYIMLIVNIKNLSRIPPASQRWKISLAFSKRS